MSIFDDPSDLLPGLLPAAWRGVRFHVADSDHEVGRRVLLTYFPGIDMPAVDDFGRFAGPIRVAGLYCGPDYIAVAAALAAAFQTPGIGTLLHPWLGEKLVVCEQPAVIRFADRRLGLVTFDASFTPIGGGYLPVVSTVSELIGAVDTTLVAATGFAEAALAGTMGVASLAQAFDAASMCAVVVGDVVAAASEAAALVPLAAGNIEAVGTAIAGIGA